jgi:hypothetical protein
MLKDLIKLANHLDSRGLTKEADYLDNIIKKVSENKTYDRISPVEVKGVPLRNIEDISSEAIKAVSDISREMFGKNIYSISTTSSNYSNKFSDKLFVRIHFRDQKTASEQIQAKFHELSEKITKYSKDNNYIVDEFVEIYLEGAAIIISISAENYIVPRLESDIANSSSNI